MHKILQSLGVLVTHYIIISYNNIRSENLKHLFLNSFRCSSLQLIEPVRAINIVLV